MIIVPMMLRSLESLRAETEWLARQPRWVLRSYVGFYATMLVTSVAIVAWATWTHFSG